MYYFFNTMRDTLSFSLQTEDKIKLCKEAKKYNMTLSEYIRIALRKVWYKDR